MRQTVLLLIVIATLSILMVSCSGEEELQGCAALGCPDNQDCVDERCVCQEGFMRCETDCIPFESCCSDADCGVAERCLDHTCADPCADVSCTAPLLCVDGACSCPDGQEQCEDSCIPEDGCCTDDECGEGTTCFENRCSAPCEIVSCNPNEYCEEGACLCKENYFEAASGICLPKGLCEVDSDCSETEECIGERCLENCYSHKEKVQISECFLEQAELDKDPSKCITVMEEKRDQCYYKVAIAAKDRSICAYLHANPPIAIYWYNQQNCVIEVAKVSQDTGLCKKTPTWTSLDPPDVDAYCRQEVIWYIESLQLESIGECGNDCACRLRYAKRQTIELCNQVCPDEQGECTDYFYFWR